MQRRLLFVLLAWTVGCSTSETSTDGRVDRSKDAVDARGSGGSGGRVGTGGAPGTGGLFGGTGGASDTAVDRPVDQPVDQASDLRADVAVDQAPDRPADVPRDVVAETAVDRPAETAAETAADQAGETTDAPAEAGNNDTGTETAGDSGSDVPPGPPSAQSVLQRNKNASRDGHFLQPTLTRAAAATMVRQTGFAATFTGAIWASPLYLANGPGGVGIFLVATNSNDVIALNETTGAVVWSKNIGSAPQGSGAGCGNVNPAGITSTPIIDQVTRTIYVAAAIGEASIDHHEVHALSVDTGQERADWPVNIAGTSAGGFTFNPQPQNQRGALSLLGDVLYVPYGGHVGDCGDYHGWVIAIDTTNPSNRGAWASAGRGEAIWASGGLASDGVALFGTTGDSRGGLTDHLDSEEVIRLTGLASLTRTNPNIYYPARWQAMDASDLDFGSSNPLVISVPGATPSKFVVATAKDGHVYFLNPDNLGGRDGHVFNLSVALEGMSIRTTPAAYQTPSGSFVAITVEGGAMCPVSVGSGTVVMGIKVAVVNGAIAPAVAWCHAYGGGTSPIATTTDGSASPLLWYISNERLQAIDGETGATVFGGGPTTCSGVTRFTSPIAANGRIIVGVSNQLCAWALP